MKTLCKLRTKPDGTLGKEIKQLLVAPKFYCRKCLRAAADKGALCKPEKL